MLNQVESLRNQLARGGALAGEWQRLSFSDVLAANQQFSATSAVAPDLSDPPTREKHLLRLYVAYRVLTRHGFTPQRVIECLEALKREGYEAGGKDPLGKIGWEEGMAWVRPTVVDRSPC